MAGVYRAIHPLGQEVAIKVLPPSRARKPQALRRFQREARLALRLQHPHIVRAYHLGQSQRLHYLVMEYLEGETLEEVLQRRGKLTPAEAIRLVHQALLGLQHIHEKGLIHRDLKPGNLMLVPGGGQDTFQATLKIVDMGLGRALFDESLLCDEERDILTSKGLVLGTPYYLAPEQARDAHRVDIRADIYSLGCVLYHLLAGRPPFPEGNLLAQMLRHMNERPVPVEEIVTDLPAGLAQVLERMLAKDPSQRYATPQQAAQALADYLPADVNGSPFSENPNTQQYLKWLKSDSRARRVTRSVPREISDSKIAVSPVAETAKPDLAVVNVAVEHATIAAESSDPLAEFAGWERMRTSKAVDARPAYLQLTRRDLILLGAGSAGTLLLIGLAYALVHLFLYLLT
jgi:serine/threonine protein kinase